MKKKIKENICRSFFWENFLHGSAYALLLHIWVFRCRWFSLSRCPFCSINSVSCRFVHIIRDFPWWQSIFVLCCCYCSRNYYALSSLLDAISTNGWKFTHCTVKLSCLFLIIIASQTHAHTHTHNFLWRSEKWFSSYWCCRHRHCRCRVFI